MIPSISQTDLENLCKNNIFSIDDDLSIKSDETFPTNTGISSLYLRESLNPHSCGVIKQGSISSTSQVAELSSKSSLYSTFSNDINENIGNEKYRQNIKSEILEPSKFNKSSNFGDKEADSIYSLSSFQINTFKCCTHDSRWSFASSIDHKEAEILQRTCLNDPGNRVERQLYSLDGVRRSSFETLYNPPLTTEQLISQISIGDMKTNCVAFIENNQKIPRFNLPNSSINDNENQNNVSNGIQKLKYIPINKYQLKANITPEQDSSNVNLLIYPQSDVLYAIPHEKCSTVPSDLNNYSTIVDSELKHIIPQNFSSSKTSFNKCLHFYENIHFNNNGLILNEGLSPLQNIEMKIFSSEKNNGQQINNQSADTKNNEIIKKYSKSEIDVTNFNLCNEVPPIKNEYISTRSIHPDDLKIPCDINQAVSKHNDDSSIFKVSNIRVITSETDDNSMPITATKSRLCDYEDKTPAYRRRKNSGIYKRLQKTFIEDNQKSSTIKSVNECVTSDKHGINSHLSAATALYETRIHQGKSKNNNANKLAHRGWRIFRRENINLQGDSKFNAENRLPNEQASDGSNNSATNEQEWLDKINRITNWQTDVSSALYSKPLANYSGYKTAQNKKQHNVKNISIASPSEHLQDMYWVDNGSVDVTSCSDYINLINRDKLSKEHTNEADKLAYNANLETFPNDCEVNCMNESKAVFPQINNYEMKDLYDIGINDELNRQNKTWIQSSPYLDNSRSDCQKMKIACNSNQINVRKSLHSQFEVPGSGLFPSQSANDYKNCQQRKQYLSQYLVNSEKNGRFRSDYNENILTNSNTRTQRIISPGITGADSIANTYENVKQTHEDLRNELSQSKQYQHSKQTSPFKSIRNTVQRNVFENQRTRSSSTDLQIDSLVCGNEKYKTRYEKLLEMTSVATTALKHSLEFLGRIPSTNCTGTKDDSQCWPYTKTHLKSQYIMTSKHESGVTAQKSDKGEESKFCPYLIDNQSSIVHFQGLTPKTKCQNNCEQINTNVRKYAPYTCNVARRQLKPNSGGTYKIRVDPQLQKKTYSQSTEHVLLNKIEDTQNSSENVDNNKLSLHFEPINMRFSLHEYLQYYYIEPKYSKDKLPSSQHSEDHKPFNEGSRNTSRYNKRSHSVGLPKQEIQLETKISSDESSPILPGCWSNLKKSNDVSEITVNNSQSPKVLTDCIAENNDICIKTKTPFAYKVFSSGRNICITKVASVDDLYSCSNKITSYICPLDRECTKPFMDIGNNEGVINVPISLRLSFGLGSDCREPNARSSTNNVLSGFDVKKTRVQSSFGRPPLQNP